MDLDPNIVVPKTVKRTPVKEVAYDTVYQPLEVVTQIECPKAKSDRVTRSQTKDLKKNIGEPPKELKETSYFAGEGSAIEKEKKTSPQEVKNNPRPKPRQSEWLRTQWMPS